MRIYCFTQIQFVCLLIFLFFAGISTAESREWNRKKPTEFFISPNGNDQNPGTKGKPFATFFGAQTAVHALGSEVARDVIVHVRGGNYPLKHTVAFDARDSGRNGHKVIYKAYKEERPVISGGVEVSNWTLYDVERNIYKAAVGGKDFRQLYVDGELAVRARFPNRESDTDFGPYLRMEGADVKGHRYQITLDDWSNVKDVSDKLAMELVIQPHWIHQNARYATHMVEGEHVWIEPASTERYSCFNKSRGYFVNASYHFENAYEFIDKPGEWFLDREKGILYYMAPKKKDMSKSKFQIPVLDVLFSIVGTAEKPVLNLEFIGLTFECTNWISPSEVGLVATQFVQPYPQHQNRTYSNKCYPQAAIKAMHVKGLGIRNNAIQNTGANGIQFFMNVDDADIEGNIIRNIGATGIELDVHGKKSATEDEMSSNTAIWNNKIYRCGQSYTNGGGLLAHNVRGLIFEHNEVCNMPYSGVQIGDQPGGYNDIGCKENTIRYNHFHHCSQLHDDGGGIYTLGGDQRGTVIAENYLHDINRSKWAGDWYVDAIYLDNYTQFIEVKDNVVHNANVGGSHNHSRNNPFSNNEPITEQNKQVVENAGVKMGYNPRQ